MPAYGKGLRPQVAQEIPVGSRWRPRLPQPLPLGRREAVLAEGVLSGQPGALQPGSDPAQYRAGLAGILPSRRELVSQAHDKTKAVLQVAKFHLSDRPLPIQAGVLKHKPGQRLYHAGLKVIGKERRDQHCRGVPLPSTPHIGEAGIAERP